MNTPHEVVWLVSVILVEAAVIDGLKLKVPNWLTFHLVIGGLAFAAWRRRSPGLRLGAGRGWRWGWRCCCRCMRSAGWGRAT